MLGVVEPKRSSTSLMRHLRNQNKCAGIKAFCMKMLSKINEGLKNIQNALNINTKTTSHFLTFPTASKQPSSPASRLVLCSIAPNTRHVAMDQNMDIPHFLANMQKNIQNRQLSRVTFAEIPQALTPFAPRRKIFEVCVEALGPRSTNELQPSEAYRMATGYGSERKRPKQSTNVLWSLHVFLLRIRR